MESGNLTLTCLLMMTLRIATKLTVDGHSEGYYARYIRPSAINRGFVWRVIVRSIVGCVWKYVRVSLSRLTESYLLCYSFQMEANITKTYVGCFDASGVIMQVMVYGKSDCSVDLMT